MTRLMDPEVLFKDGGWTIEGIPGNLDVFDDVYHKCAWSKNFFMQKKELALYHMKTPWQ